MHIPMPPNYKVIGLLVYAFPLELHFSARVCNLLTHRKRTAETLEHPGMPTRACGCVVTRMEGHWGAF
jgi:hypothetical protein